MGYCKDIFSYVNNYICQRKVSILMKLSEKLLKQLVRESVEEMDQQDHGQLSAIYSDVYKERYGVRPRHMDFSKYSEEEIQDMIDDIEQDSHHGDHLSHEEEFEDMMDQHGHDADNAEREFMHRAAEHRLMLSPEEGEDLPFHSGMGRRLSESLKLVIREAIEENTVDECGVTEEEALDEFISEGKPKLKKKKPVEAKKDKPAKKMNSGFAAFIKKAKEKAKK